MLFTRTRSASLKFRMTHLPSERSRCNQTKAMRFKLAATAPQDNSHRRTWHDPAGAISLVLPLAAHVACAGGLPAVPSWPSLGFARGVRTVDSPRNDDGWAAHTLTPHFKCTPSVCAHFSIKKNICANAVDGRAVSSSGALCVKGLPAIDRGASVNCLQPAVLRACASGPGSASDSLGFSATRHRQMSWHPGNKHIPGCRSPAKQCIAPSSLIKPKTGSHPPRQPARSSAA